MGRYWRLSTVAAAVMLTTIGVVVENTAGQATPSIEGSSQLSPQVQQQLRTYESIFRGCDANSDGTVAPGEVKGAKKFMFEKTARNSGLDPERPISLTQFREALLRRFSQAGGTSSPSSPEAGGTPAGAAPGTTPTASQPGTGAATPPSSPAASKPLVPGFGVQQNLPGVPGFGGPAGGSGRGFGRSPGGDSGHASDSGASSPGSENSQEYKVRRYAESLLKRYDKNKSGYLEKDEWGQMRGDPKAADRNKDGVITLEELTARFLDYSRHGRDHDHSKPASPSGTAGSGNDAERKSRRFLTPAERFPEGLPDWFPDRDDNGDGQVSMAEYSGLWSESKAGEFKRYDVNGDGVITPAECLKVEKQE